MVKQRRKYPNKVPIEQLTPTSNQKPTIMNHPALAAPAALAALAVTRLR